MDENNPLRSVAGVLIPSPSRYIYTLEDVSSNDAGRLNSTKMEKLRIGQVVAIELEWRGLKTDEATRVLKSFNDEYIDVEYLDLLIGDYVTVEFYVGNRTAPMYNNALNLWENVSFKIIMRQGHIYDKANNEWVLAEE